MQIIFHIDLNAFFASAEISVNPHLKGKPIVICRESRRAIITTASYEARKYGVHSAMPLFKAKELCPHLITVEPHFPLYKSLSQNFFNIISQFSNYLEVASIDECYVDMTNYIQENQLDPRVCALRIQEKVYQELKLDCSIGIAPNKFLAKMASDMKKPKGITIITHQNYKEKLWSLPISSMIGIGKKTQPKLIAMGILTIGDLAKYENYEKIKHIFGKNALIYYQRANGKDFSKMNYSRNDLKSIGNSTTFERDSHDEYFIKNKFKELSLEVSKRAQKRNLISNNISITLKYTRDKSRTKQTIINHYTNDYETIYATALFLFESIYQGEDLRLVGVSMNHVLHIHDFNQQLSLFEESQQEIKESSRKQIDQLIQDLNENIQGNAFMKASSLLDEQPIQTKYLKNNE